MVLEWMLGGKGYLGLLTSNGGGDDGGVVVVVRV